MDTRGKQTSELQLAEFSPAIDNLVGLLDGCFALKTLCLDVKLLLFLRFAMFWIGTLFSIVKN